jgi:hypothetical protein
MCNSVVAKCICCFWRYKFWRLKAKWNWPSHFQVLKLLTYCFIADHFLCSPLQEECVEVVLSNEYAESKVVEVQHLFVTPIKIQTSCHQSSSFFKVLTISILVFQGFYNLFYVFVIPNLLLLIFKFSSRYWKFRCFASSCFFYVAHTLVFIINFQVFFKLLEVSIFCRSYDIFLSFVNHVSLPLWSLSIFKFSKGFGVMLVFIVSYVCLSHLYSSSIF